MKYLLGILLAVILTSWASAEPPSERDLKNRSELYERMSMNFFAIYHNILHSDLPNEDRERWAKEGANTAFYYWVTTRKGGTRKSEKVEHGIAFFYEAAVKLNMVSGFPDPLGRKRLIEKGVKDLRVNIVGFKMSQKEYEESVNEFQDFIDKALAARQERRAKPEAENQ